MLAEDYPCQHTKCQTIVSVFRSPAIFTHCNLLSACRGTSRQIFLNDASFDWRSRLTATVSPLERVCRLYGIISEAFFADKDTIKRGQCQIYLNIAETEYLRRSQSTDRRGQKHRINGCSYRCSTFLSFSLISVQVRRCERQIPTSESGKGFDVRTSRSIFIE